VSSASSTTYIGILNNTPTLLGNVTGLTAGDNWSCSVQAISTTNSSVWNTSANVTVGSGAATISGRVGTQYSWTWAALQIGNRTITWDGVYAHPWIWHVWVSGSGNKTMNGSSKNWSWVNE
jgi:hypothetical protein